MHPVLEISSLDPSVMCSDPFLFQLCQETDLDQTPSSLPTSSDSQQWQVTDGRDHNIVTNVSDEETGS